MSVNIDGEKLARALENGLDPYELSFFRGLLLGFPRCGEVATILKTYAQDMGYSAETVISKPNLKFDPNLEHVMTVIHDQPGNSLIVDPTWGQFLYYIGYDNAYDKLTGRQVFPDYSEQIMTYRMSDRSEAVRKFARSAFMFKQAEQNLIDEVVPVDIDGDRISLGVNWLPGLETEEQLAEAFDPIWDPSNFSPFEASGVMLKLGHEASARMLGGIITVR